MNPTTGTLHKNGVLVTKSKDIGRLFGKSKFGTPVSKNKLQLDFIEAIFLCEEKKLVVYEKEELLTWKNLIAIAAQSQYHFETEYLIFSDLRRRGHQLRILKNDSPFTFYTTNQQELNNSPSLIATFSEREPCTIQTLLTLIKQAKNQQTTCWLAIADEEGDITYYALDSYPLIGKQKPMSFTQTTGLLLKDRVLITTKSTSKSLHEKEFFGKPLGSGLQISLVEALYLVKNSDFKIHLPSGKKVNKKQFEKMIETRQTDIDQRYIVFDDLKKHGLIVKTGFKFGNHFRAYSDKPDKTHAEYLIHAVSLNQTIGWSEVSRAIRLAHSVNKKFLFASIDSHENICYLSFERIRP